MTRLIEAQNAAATSRVLGLFLAFFAALELLSEADTDTRPGAVTNLAAGLSSPRFALH